MDVKDLVAGGVRENRRCFEEAAYLLLFGTLPSRDELDEFCALLADLRTLPRNFVLRCGDESSQSRYYEFSVEKRSDACIL